MSLPRCDDQAAHRALDRKCAVPDSVASRRTVRQLSAEPLLVKEAFLQNTTVWGLGNLVRCALEAGLPPNFITNGVRPPRGRLHYFAGCWCNYYCFGCYLFADCVISGTVIVDARVRAS